MVVLVLLLTEFGIYILFVGQTLVGRSWDVPCPPLANLTLNLGIRKIHLRILPILPFHLFLLGSV